MSSLALYQDPAFRGDAPVDGGVKPNTDADTKGNWPRMLNLDVDVEDRLKTWIDEELNAFYTERQPMMEDWKRYQTLYWAAPATKERNFPFKRAANVVIPLAAIAVEAIQARFMNTLFAVEPFWSIRAKSKEWRTTAKPLEEFLQSEVEAPDGLRLYEFYNEWLLEFCKLGTAVAKTGYEKIIKKGLKKVGDAEEEVYATIRNGGVVERVPLGNFVMRFADLDPQLAQLVGEKHEFTWSQLKRMAQSGRMLGSAIEKIRHTWVLKNQPGSVNDVNEVQETINKHSNAEPLWTSIFNVHELWVSFDVDGDGWDEEIVLDYHKETRTILSIRYNWYDDLHRPYRTCRYIPVEGIWVGIGICKQTEQFQEEATTIHRQRLDNATLANMAQIVIRKGLGYGDGEPLFPGKMWFVDNVQNDIKEFKLSEVYPSSYNNEESIVRYFEKRTGANEAILGLPQEGTPGTATSDLSRLAEGNKRFDLVLKNVKRFSSLIGYDVVTNMQLFGTQQIHWLVVGDDGVEIEKVLNMPSILVRKGAIIKLTVTDSITNKDVEQRQWLTLFQVLTSYYREAAQFAQIFAQITGDPTILATIAQRALITSDAVLTRLAETFGIPDAEEFTLTGGASQQNEPENAGASGASSTPRLSSGVGGS